MAGMNQRKNVSETEDEGKEYEKKIEEKETQSNFFSVYCFHAKWNFSRSIRNL